MEQLRVGPEKLAIQEVRKALLELATCEADESTKQEAIKAFTAIVEVKNVTIRDCTFSAGAGR